MPSVTRSRAAARERREAVGERVLRAVEELLADGTPYTELPVLRIAERAGIARSTFYLHFPDKSSLLIRMAELGTKDLFAAAEQWWTADHHDGEAGVARAIGQMIAEFRKHQQLLGAVTELAAYDPDAADYWMGRIGGFIELVQRRLDQEQAAGRVNPAMDTAATAKLLTWMVERTIAAHFRSAAADDEGDQRLAQALARAIWLTTYADANL